MPDRRGRLTCRWRRGSLRHDDDAAQGELALIEAESTVRGARELSEALFQDIKGKREYQQALGTREQTERFTRELTRRAGLLNKLLGLELSDAVVEAVAGRLARRVVAWKHDSSSQRKRQELAVAARRKKTQDRDRDILQYAAMKLSQRDIARMVQVPPYYRSAGPTAAFKRATEGGRRGVARLP